MSRDMINSVIFAVSFLLFSVFIFIAVVSMVPLAGFLITGLQGIL